MAVDEIILSAGVRGQYRGTLSLLSTRVHVPSTHSRGFSKQEKNKGEAEEPW